LLAKKWRNRKTTKIRQATNFTALLNKIKTRYGFFNPLPVLFVFAGYKIKTDNKGKKL
jgi:hypothetical protein